MRISLSDRDIQDIKEALLTIRNNAMPIQDGKAATYEKYRVAERRIDDILKKLETPRGAQ